MALPLQQRLEVGFIVLVVWGDARVLRFILVPVGTRFLFYS